MRCDDLSRELASPTGAFSPAEMASHLASCSGCAERSRQAARFDRIWEATRPIEPTPAQLDALWASASVALEAGPAPAPLRLVPRRSWLKPALILAQAAALLVAAGLFWTQKAAVETPQVTQTPTPRAVPVQVAPPLDGRDSSGFPTLTLNVNEGETLLVSIPKDQTTKPQVARLKESRPDQSTLIPPGTPFDVINDAEMMVVTSL